MVSKKEVPSIEFLWLGLYAFAGFSLELILDVVVKSIRGSSLSLGWHLLMTSMLWLLCSLGLIFYSKNRFDFDVLKNKAKLRRKEKIILSILTVIVILVTSLLFKGLKPMIEFNNGLKQNYLLLLLRMMYYACEAILITLSIAFSQKFFEDKFKISSKIPVGGFFLATTWGVIHLFLQGISGGLFAIFFSVIAGLIYTNCQKDFKKSYVLICLIFIL